MIPFNKPYCTGNEVKYIEDAIKNGKLSGDGKYTKKCSSLFESLYGFDKALLTTSCTSALEMIAILLNIEPGDEVIMPSYTFVSTANAFELRGATIRFCDSCDYNPNIDVNEIKKLITPKTKAIVVVHYAGIACDMDAIIELADEHNIMVVEDAAQAIDSYYKGRPLGSIGSMSAFSFHETKNVISGEGGMIVLNDGDFASRAEIIREKGTNRSAFFRGEINKYGWVDVGSSYLPSELIAAFLYAQVENIDDIQSKRKEIWKTYHSELLELENQGKIKLPVIPEYATNNAHMFYVLTESIEQRSALITYLKENGVHSVFHYLSLHKSEYFESKHGERELPNCERYSDTLLRLPLFYELSIDEAKQIAILIKDFFRAL